MCRGPVLPSHTDSGSLAKQLLWSQSLIGICPWNTPCDVFRSAVWLSITITIPVRLTCTCPPAQSLLTCIPSSLQRSFYGEGDIGLYEILFLFSVATGRGSIVLSSDKETEGI